MDPDAIVFIYNYDFFEVDMAVSVTGKVDQRDTASGRWAHIRQTCTLACESEHVHHHLCRIACIEHVQCIRGSSALHVVFAGLPRWLCCQQLQAALRATQRSLLRSNTQELQDDPEASR